MKNSLFRIDRHSVAAEESKVAGFVVLPCLEEMMQRAGQDEEAPAEKDTAEWPAAEEDASFETEEAARQKEIALLEKRICEARKEAEEIIRTAEETAAEIKQKAVAQGYEEGCKRAEKNAKEEREGARKSLAGALEALGQAADDLYAEMENGVLDLSLYIAEHIIKTEIQDNDEAYKNMIRTVLAEIRNQSNIILKVGKDEFERFFADAQDDFGDVLKNSGIKVVQDISLQPGDCLVETEFGYIDAGILTQLRRLEYSMKQFGTGI